MKKLISFSIGVLVFAPLFSVSAQNSDLPPSDGSSWEAPAQPAPTPGGAWPPAVVLETATSSSVPAQTVPQTRATSTAATTSLAKPVPKEIGQIPTVATTSPNIASSDQSSTTPPISSGLNIWLALSLGALAVVGGAFLQKSKKKKSKNGNQCDRIKAALDQKKTELAAVKSQFSLQQAIIDKMKQKFNEKIDEKKSELKEMAVKMVKEKIFELDHTGTVEKTVGAAEDIQGTYDDLTGVYEKAVQIYETLKAKLGGLTGQVKELEAAYAACNLGRDTASSLGGEKIELPDMEDSPLKATIIEHSLEDKKMLENLKIERSWQDGDSTFHTALFSEEQIPELQKAMSLGPWYVHLFKDGSDDITVVFKEKVFTLTYSDRSTWKDAVEYGKSIGIPEEQLNFKISE